MDPIVSLYLFFDLKEVSLESSLGVIGDASGEYLCNLVWSPAGTTAVHHVCLLTLLSCVLFDGHQVGQVITPPKTTKKKLNLISILDRLLSQRGLLSQRLIKSYSTDVTEISPYLFRIDLYLGLLVVLRKRDYLVANVLFLLLKGFGSPCDEIIEVKKMLKFCLLIQSIRRHN